MVKSVTWYQPHRACLSVTENKTTRREWPANQLQWDVAAVKAWQSTEGRKPAFSLKFIQEHPNSHCEPLKMGTENLHFNHILIGWFQVHCDDVQRWTYKNALPLEKLGLTCFRSDLCLLSWQVGIMAPDKIQSAGKHLPVERTPSEQQCESRPSTHTAQSGWFLKHSRMRFLASRRHSEVTGFVLEWNKGNKNPAACLWCTTPCSALDGWMCACVYICVHIIYVGCTGRVVSLSHCIQRSSL